MRRLWDDALRNWATSMAYPPIFECHLQTAPEFEFRKPSHRSKPSVELHAPAQMEPSRWMNSRGGAGTPGASRHHQLPGRPSAFDAC